MATVFASINTCIWFTSWDMHIANYKSTQIIVDMAQIVHHTSVLVLEYKTQKVLS